MGTSIKFNNMNHPFFSIITASYNNDRSIQKTISSIKKQTFQNYEHIVIDGGSTDQTFSILQQISKHYCLRYISEKDDGIADAMNKGIHLARGKYIVFIHADDELAHNNTLRDVFNDISINQNKVCAYSIYYTSNDERNVASPIRVPYWYKFRNTIPHQGAFVHTDIFRKFGKFDTSFSISMDYKFFYKILLAGEPIYYSNRVASLMGSGGISSNPANVRDRLTQEFRIQNDLETSFFWKLLQKTFQFLYFIYKIYFFHSTKKQNTQ